MEFGLCSYGLVLDINPNNFISEGLVYISKDYADVEAESLANAKAKIQKSTFGYITNQMIKDYKSESSFKNKQLLNDEISKAFEERKDRRTDVIVMAQDSFSSKYKRDLTSSSILYLNMEGNVSVGFFIDKMVAQIIFRNKEVNSNVDEDGTRN